MNVRDVAVRGQYLVTWAKSSEFSRLTREFGKDTDFAILGTGNGKLADSNKN